MSNKTKIPRDYVTGEELGNDILTALRQIKQGRVGKIRVFNAEKSIAARARGSVGLSQSEFARLLGISVRTLQDWEQGRREPTGAARTLLTVANKHPEALLDSLPD